MLLKEVLKEERTEGRAEGRAEGKAEAILLLLQEIGAIPDELTEKIMNEKNPTVLNEYLKYAAKAESIEDFAHKFA
ncbi:MAG: hypothetical protein K2K10_00575 [Acetatifactor sp.]|nr:hypothetical protein [Acetatifactor sp.]